MTTTFKAFLIEQNRTIIIPDERAKDFVRRYCDRYVRNLRGEVSDTGAIFRGIHGRSDVHLYADSSGHERVSRNTLNYYTLLMDHILPSWKRYPDRSKSFICSTSVNTAGSYGNAYVAFPRDGTLVGVCSEEDVWTSFSKAEGILDFVDMDGFNKFLQNMFKVFKVSNASDRDANVFGNALKELNNIFKNNLENFDSSQEFIEKMMEFVTNNSNISFGKFPLDVFLYEWIKYKNIIKMLDDVMDPDENKFRLTVSEKVPTQYKNRDQEIWFSGPAVFVDSNSVNTFLKELNNETNV